MNSLVIPWWKYNFYPPWIIVHVTDEQTDGRTDWRTELLQPNTETRQKQIQQFIQIYQYNASNQYGTLKEYTQFVTLRGT